MTALIELYVTLVPAILAGVVNMIWCSSPVAAPLKRPIDGGAKLGDGRRILGDNKTWKGFLGMIVFGAVFTVLWGMLCQNTLLGEYNYIYRNCENTVGYNLVMGIAFGLAYALFELPNSFLKRRMGIEPGKPSAGWHAPLFVFLDQADSVFGLVLVVCAVYSMPLWFYLLYVLLGAGTHIVFNVLLYALHLRKNPF